MKLGMAGRIVDENGKDIGFYNYLQNPRHNVTHRSPTTGMDITYNRQGISGTLEDGRKFRGHEDRAPGVIGFDAFEKKYGIPASIIEVKFTNIRGR